MNLKVKMLTYVFMFTLGYTIGGCAKEVEVRKLQLENMAAQTQLYSMNGDLIEPEGPLYCVDQPVYEEFGLQLESMLK